MERLYQRLTISDSIAVAFPIFFNCWFHKYLKFIRKAPGISCTRYQQSPMRKLTCRYLCFELWNISVRGLLRPLNKYLTHRPRWYAQPYLNQIYTRTCIVHFLPRFCLFVFSFVNNGLLSRHVSNEHIYWINLCTKVNIVF